MSLPSRALRLIGSALVLGLGFVWPAAAQAPVDIIDSALSRVETLYLERGDLDTQRVCASVGQRLELEIEWLMVEAEGCTLRLTRGGDEALGVTTIADWPDLNRGLRELAEHLRLAEDPSDLHATLDGVPLDVVLLKGVTDALDRHSRVLYGERLQAFDKRLKGTFYGVGVVVEMGSGGGLLIDELYAGHPGAAAGLQTGDALLRIDGVSTLGMRPVDASARLAGEEGSQVELEVQRGQATPFTVSVRREEIRIPNVRHRVLDGGFAYLRIDHFSELTIDYLDDALRSLDAAGALERGLVIDLRGNTGGSMLQSARSVDAFVTGGDLLRTVGPDGGRVRGLAERMWADDDETEPQIPIAVLQNRRTASGAEILSGALRELDRAVIIGDRSYGKGTVQKVYTLDEDTRLKLTVARYLLAGGVSIADVGIDPDLPVGRVVLSAMGVDIQAPAADPEGPEPVLFVQEELGWRPDSAQTPPARGDLSLELALRVLARSAGLSRYQLLAAAGEVRELTRAEEEQRIAEAFAARGLDWSPAPRPAGRPQVELALTLPRPAQAGAPAEVQVQIQNTGEAPLHQALLRLASDDRTWDGLVIPVGFLAPGESAVRSAVTTPYVGAPTRESLVYAVFESDQRPDTALGGWALGYAGDQAPGLSMELRLVPHDGAHRANIQLRHDGPAPLTGLRVRFEYPESANIELGGYDASLDALAPGQLGRFTLDLSLLDETEEPLPLFVFVEADGYGELVDWPLALPRDGSPVSLAAPRLSTQSLPTSAQVGSLSATVVARDDQAVDHLVVWQGRDKVAYQRGSAATLNADLSLEITAGENRFLFEAIDDQGLRTRQQVFITGVEGRPVADDSDG